MDIRNQQGDHVAKQKNAQKSNPRKAMQDQINQIGGATSSIIGEIRVINNHLIGLETLIMSLSEFLGKSKEFEAHIKKKIEKFEEEKGQEKSKKI